MEFGKSLREAREAKGYTTAQIAETTHMLVSIVEGREKEDFSRIAAPIYGRGFVKLYCEAVGLEAKPFVEEFMEIMNGNRCVTIKERPIEMPAPVQDAVPPPPPPPPAAEQDLFTREPASHEPLPAVEPPLTAKPQANISRYASPFRSEETAPSAFPVLPWRLILLAVAGLAILAVLICGIRALYCATSAKPASETSAVAVTETAEKTAPKPVAQSAAKPATRTRQQNIPALYID